MTAYNQQRKRPNSVVARMQKKTTHTNAMSCASSNGAARSGESLFLFGRVQRRPSAIIRTSATRAVNGIIDKASRRVAMAEREAVGNRMPCVFYSLPSLPLAYKYIYIYIYIYIILYIFIHIIMCIYIIYIYIYNYCICVM